MDDKKKDEESTMPKIEKDKLNNSETERLKSTNEKSLFSIISKLKIENSEKTSKKQIMTKKKNLISTSLKKMKKF